MNRLLLFILFLLSLTGKAQINIYNVSLTDSTKGFLYRGFNNRINIYGIDDYSNVKVISNLKDFRFRKDSTTVNSYILIPSWEKNDTIKILKNDSILFLKRFECLSISYFKAIYGKTEDTILTKNEIISNPYLNIILPNCYYKHNSFIVRFNVNYILYKPKNNQIKNKTVGNYKVKYKRQDKSTVIANVTQLRDSIYFYNKDNNKITAKIRRNKTNTVFGNYLSNLHISIIENMKAGDKIYFENIIIRSANGTDLILKPLTITIK